MRRARIVRGLQKRYGAKDAKRPGGAAQGEPCAGLRDESSSGVAHPVC